MVINQIKDRLEQAEVCHLITKMQDLFYPMISA